MSAPFTLAVGAASCARVSGFVMGSPVLRALAIAAGMVGGFNAVLEAAGLLYIVRDLALTPGLIGLVFSANGVGWLVGASLAKRTTRRMGLGRSAAAGVFLMGAADVIIPLAGGPAPVVIVLLAGATFLFGAGLVTYIIGRVSLQQSMDAGPPAGKGERRAQSGVPGGHPPRRPGRRGAR